MEGGHNGFIFRARREEDAEAFVREWYRRPQVGGRLVTVLLVLAAIAFVIWGFLT
jgi:hypothetical protein